MKINQIIESVGGTSAGAVASVAMPLGGTQKRNNPEKAPKVAKGKKYGNVISEGKMKDLAYDIQHLDAGNFMKKYGHPKEYFTKKLGNPPVSEAELQEDDLILVPGQIRKKDKSFIPHDKDRRDHEVEMARSELYAAAKDAMRIYKVLKDRSEDEGLMGWQQSYITLASDYLNSVADSLEHDAKVAEMTGGVVAGGMSNFEESAPEGFDFKSYYPGAYSRRAVALAEKFCKQYGITKEFDQRFVVEIIDAYLKDARGQPVDLKQIKSKLATDLRAVGMKYNMRKKFQEPPDMLKKYPFVRKNITNAEDMTEAEKQGLWANIHAKRERIKKGSGERMRKPGSKGAPTKQAFKQSQKTSKK